MFNNNFEVSETISATPDYQFSDFVHELHNLYMIRLGMSISESARYIVDTIEDIEIALGNDVSAFEYFQQDLADGVKSDG